jgi:uncharacterized protein (DUF433 family)/uncharacterized protein YbcV (DUF1398 family)
MSKKPLVFLAHNSQDKPQVRIVADALKQKGINTWLDEEQIPPGVLFQEHLQKAIAEIDYALIFIGKSGVGQWQAIEIHSFFSKLVSSRIPVIPVLLPGVKKLPDDMVFLREINYVQFLDDIKDQNTINKIVWGITGKSSYINYDGLESFLRSGLWREANAETKRIILQSANREKDGYLHNEEMRDFDDSVLLQLDSLWQRYSQNRFGFSIQKKILQDCQQDASIFGSRVGWKQGDSWINEAHVNYSLSAPLGHLPYGMLQLVDMNNAIAEGIVNAQWAVTKVLVTQDWQRQLISDAVGVFEWVSGNKNFNSEEFKKGLDFQLKHDEAWWQGERAEVVKIKNLCLLLFSCPLLNVVENIESNILVTAQVNNTDEFDKQPVGLSQVNTSNSIGFQLTVNGGTVNINPPVLSDSQFTLLAKLVIEAFQNTKLSEMLNKQQSGTLSSRESQELEYLMQIYREDLLRKATALSNSKDILWPDIEKTPNVCGGSACIKNTRITIWGLVESRRIGYSEYDILSSYPTISATDLANAWAYAAAFPEEIEAEIKENNDVMYEEQ